MEKILKCDFYRVVMPPEERTPFETLLQNIFNLAGATRTFDNGQYNIRLVNLVQQGGYLLGDMARIRMNDIPDKMTLSGERESIELEDDQGLGEMTSFIYNPNLQVLALLRNRHSVTATGLVNYIQQLGHAQGIIIFEHILQADAYQKLAQMTIARKMEISFAAPGNSQVYANLGLRPQTMLNLMNATPKVKIAMSFGLDRDRNLTLPIQAIRTVVREMRQNYGEEIIKLQISGKQHIDEKTELVDMLQEIMTEKESVTMRGNQRAITDGQRHTAIERAYLRKLPEITRILQNV